jgi:hypothetical protein
MPNYTLIGGDQKQYGPVTEAQLRQWILDGRVNLQSCIKTEGDVEWRPLSAFPELANMFGGRTVKTRQIIWNIYAIPITCLILFGEVITLVEGIDLLRVLDLAISIPSLVALQLHIWDRRFISVKFWKPYAIVFLLWDFLYNLMLEPLASGEKFDPWNLITPLILVPLYVSVFRYAFRKWDKNGLPSNAPEPTATAP